MNPEHAELLAEIDRRRSATAGLDGFTAEALADGHQKQLAFTVDESPAVIALCSRRAGKTTGVGGGRLARRSLRKPGSNRIYVALSSVQARDIMWEPIWKPLCEAWKLPVHHNETRMVTHFANGSKVRFTGTDDVETIKRELGAGLDEAVVDECQDQKDSVLVPLVTKILPPALADRNGALVLCGTVPEVAAGLFWRIWSGKGKWSRHNWSLFDNPHFPDAHARLAEYLAANPDFTEASPIVQREWFGRFVFDEHATAYRYSPERNGYDAPAPDWLAEVAAPAGRILAAVPAVGVDSFSVGIDPGSRDRTAVEVWGWGSASQEVQHVFEWATPRGARMTWGQIAEVLAVVQQRFAPAWWYYDAGSSQNELDTFTADYGVPVIRAAMKTDLPGQVRRNNDLLAKGWLRVMRGSALEEDYQKARWDPDARGRGLWQWASGWHPDPSEAARYALQGYFSAYAPPPAEKAVEELRRERQDLRMRRRAALISGRRLPEDEEASVFADDDAELWG